ncbi:MAG TPA: (2Fe-2S)-binding protein [Mycobacterium sp.]
MYVCLCGGITNQTVSEAVAAGASTSNQVAAACGAGADCARCRRTIQTIIAARKTMSDCAGPDEHLETRPHLR